MKKHELFDALRERVLSLDLSPGSALDEAALSALYGVSRTPLREVFQRLAAEGFIVLETNRGAAVASMDLAVMRSFFQTAPMIYAAAARLAAENATGAQVEHLKDAQSSFRAAVKADDAPQMAISNHRFHELIGEMGDSPYLSPSLRRLLIDHTRMSQTFYRARTKAERTLVKTASTQHDEMIDAIAKGESARAVQLTLDHWALSRDRIERYVRPDPLPIDPAEDIRDAV